MRDDEARVITLERGLRELVRRLDQDAAAAGRAFEGAGRARAGDGGACTITFNFTVTTYSGGAAVSGAVCKLIDTGTGVTVGTATTDAGGLATVTLNTAATYRWVVSSLGYADTYGTLSASSCGDTVSISAQLYTGHSFGGCAGDVPTRLRLDDSLYGITTTLVWDGSVYWQGCAVVSVPSGSTCLATSSTPIFYYVDYNGNLTVKYLKIGGAGANANCTALGDCSSTPNATISWSDGAGGSTSILYPDSGTTCSPLNWPWSSRVIASSYFGIGTPYYASTNFLLHPPF